MRRTSTSDSTLIRKTKNLLVEFPPISLKLMTWLASRQNWLVICQTTTINPTFMIIWMQSRKRLLMSNLR